MAGTERRMPMRLRTRLLLVVLGLVAVVVVAEIALRALIPDGRLLGPDAVDAFAERALAEADTVRADPEFGHLPVLDGPVYDKFGLLRRWGTRGSRVDKRDGVFRLLLLGDAMTRRASLAEPLRALWRGGEAEFLNAGVDDWNPVQEVEFYFRHQQQLAADHVVLSLHNDDLTESTVACIQDEQLTLCNPGSRVTLDPVWYRRSVLYRLYKNGAYTDRRRPEHYTCRAAEVEAALQRLQGEIAARGARLTVLVLPILAAESDWPPHQRRARESSLAMLARLGVEIVDLQPVCEEVAALGVPMRATPTADEQPSDGLAALLGLVSAGALYAPPPVRCIAEPRQVAAGGSQRFTLAAGAGFAGRRFLVLGSMRGVVPVTDLPRGRVALAADGYLERTADLQQPLFAGELDGEGRAEIMVPVPGGAAPGSVVWHLAVVADARGIHYERLGWPLPMLLPAR